MEHEQALQSGGANIQNNPQGTGGTKVVVGTGGTAAKKRATALGARLSRKAADNMLSCRYELKYRISEAKAHAIARFVRPYLHVDKYASLRTDGFYPISSLYFDSDGLNLCRETLEGKVNRFKLRVRAYSDNVDSPCFFEIKRRINRVIIKSRSRVRHEDVGPIITTGKLPEAQYCSDLKTLRQFLLYTSYLNARPMVLVRYLREAYEGDSDNRVRVTFDRELCCKTTREARVEINGPGWQRIPLDFVTLEIKFTARYPAWLSEMTKAFNLNLSAMSKYASSIRSSCAAGFYSPIQFCGAAAF